MNKNKNIFICFTLFFILLLGISIKIKNNSSDHHIIYLNEKDINNASLQNIDGYLINKPGTYFLNDNVNWSAATHDNFAITIAANNVVLNGNNYCIKQLDSSINHAIGIQIKEGYNNIKIKNIKLDTFSGGGIWFRGNNSNLVIKNIKTTNCGYYGMTHLDIHSLPKNASKTSSQAILFDGGHNKPIKNVQVIDCTFVETGILKTNEQSEYELFCSAIYAYYTDNIIIKGCSIDGCIGRNKSWGITLIESSNALISDAFITDVFSTYNAQGIYTHNVDGEIQDTIQTSIISHVRENLFSYMLDNHESFKEPVKEGSVYNVEFNHLKNIIPKHQENEDALFTEHKWRELRTLYRLVCYNSDKRSKTSGIYAKWVELFCEKVLDIKVKVVNGFANLYLNGDTPLPAHRDQYKKWIIGLSFGETRTLDFVPDDNDKEMISFPMESGDIFIFAPEVNNRYQHRMLAEPEKMNRRINLTYFLEIFPGEDEKKLLQKPELNKKLIPTFQEAETLFYVNLPN